MAVDEGPDSISTPEGDGEDGTAPADGLVTPPGSAPSEYQADKRKPKGIEKFIDEVERGEYM